MVRAARGLYNGRLMKRRTFLSGGLAATAAARGWAAPTPDRRTRAIKVAKVEVLPLDVRERYGWVVVQVTTDAGLVGIGDATESGRGDPAIAKLREFAEWIKGRSVFDVERFRQRALRNGPGPARASSCAFSGIEQALYDIQGQALGVPTSGLFGGRLRNAIRNYANINRASATRTPEGFRPVAAGAIAAGFDSIKIAPFDRKPRDASAAELDAHFERGVRSVRMIREMLGPSGDVLVEGHSNFDLPRALATLDDLAEQDVFWFEEAIRSLEDMAGLRRQAPMTIAGGERLFGVAEALEYVRLGAVDTLMPDVKWCAGCLELKKISALAEAAGMEIAPHGPSSPVGNLAAAHVCSTLPNFSILEFTFGDAPWRAELLDPPEPIERGGMLRLSERPGFGHKLNMATVKRRLKSL